MSLDIVYLARNRRAFTEVTIGCLIQNTNWSLVDRLIVYDDGSEDTTAEWLHATLPHLVYRHQIRETNLGSPVAVMADYLASDPADWFVKLDNDVAVPDGWLDRLLEVRDGYPELGIDLLGFEAGMTIVPSPTPGTVHVPDDWDGCYGFEESSHIGGVGLMRSAALQTKNAPLAAAPGTTYYGFTEWQTRHPEVVRGWITPDLRAPLLDRVPVEPYVSLSDQYIEKGWQRPWGKYRDEVRWAFGWLLPEQAQ